MHGQLADRGDANAPHCEDCHGTHTIRGRRDSKSPTFPTNVPTLCASCHREGEKAAQRYTGEQHNILQNYVMSIHGKGLLESGLVVTAMCTDCHTAHHVLPAGDSASSVFRANIPHTCSRCHNGIYDQFRNSVHYTKVGETDKPLPNCDDCHKAHEVMRTDKTGFRFEIIDQCGRCHEDVTESYFETFHGKVSKLGYAAAAKCYDCHGAHDILPPDNPDSKLSRSHVVETCGQCHERSHLQFAGYLTHATHHDRDKYPILFFTFWFMASLLLGTLVIAGTHTIMWLPRSFQTMREQRKIRKKLQNGQVYQRFRPHQRRLHILVIISFLGLALTGMTLKFSYLSWARWISDILGGFETAGYIHRVCAAITFFYFFAHLYFVIKDKRKERKTWKQILFSRDSMVFNKHDLSEAWGTIKWFFGTGPRPAYGRWTYWEKFDYFAVFWGVAVIGSTGLMLWFPELFTLILPGWFINVATIIHSDEALLAVAFIFTVHFFNTHFRPDKFPMDTVIFTGRMSLEELKEERPREYAEMLKSRKLKKNLVQPLPPPIVRSMRVFATVALLLGLSIILLIVYAEVFGYR
jgi:thiosulfate reductase cytochrome b subunit